MLCRVNDRDLQNTGRSVRKIAAPAQGPGGESLPKG